MARPLTGLPQKKLQALRIPPEKLAKVHELATEIDASVSEVMRVLLIGALGVFTVAGIKALIDAEHDRHMAALEEAQERMARQAGVPSGTDAERSAPKAAAGPREPDNKAAKRTVIPRKAATAKPQEATAA